MKQQTSPAASLRFRVVMGAAMACVIVVLMLWTVSHNHHDSVVDLGDDSSVVSTPYSDNNNKKENGEGDIADPTNSPLASEKINNDGLAPDEATAGSTSHEQQSRSSHRTTTTNPRLDKKEIQEFLLKYFGLNKRNNVNDEHEHDVFDNNTAFCVSRRKMVWRQLEKYASPALLAALRKQRRRHQAVADGRPFPGQKYLIWSLSGGLGNRFQSIVSCFVAAMLSDRVLLMKDWFMPLPHSSVKQKPVIIPSPRTDHYFLEDLSKLLNIESNRPLNEELLCPLLPMMSLRAFSNMYPHEFDRRRSSHQPQQQQQDGNNGIIKDQSSPSEDPRGHVQHAKIDIAARHDKTLRRWNRLLCSNMSSRSSSSSGVSTDGEMIHSNKRSVMPASARLFFPEKFVYIWTNQYFLPGFYANPFHARQMRDMFPDAHPYAVLVRAIVIPSLEVVNQVRSFFDSNTNIRPLRYVGLQVRAFQDRTIFELDKQFQACYDKHYSDGNINDKKKNVRSGESDGAGEEPFFLATLHEHVRNAFAKKYGSQRVVTLAPPRHEQKTGTARFDQEALADMFLLALGKDLVVSPGSTFGSFVAAYIQSVPRVVDLSASSSASSSSLVCKRGKFLEPCFASLHWYDKLLGRAEKLSCKLETIPAASSGC